MIGCETARQLMDARVDGEIGPAEAIDLKVHLGGCPDCREVASGLESVTFGLLYQPIETFPEPDLDAVFARTIGKRDVVRLDERRRAMDPSQPVRPVRPVRSMQPVRSSRLVFIAAAAVLAAVAIVPLAVRFSAPPEPTTAEIERAAQDVRLVLDLTSRAVRSAESAARNRVIEREVTPTLRHVPVRWDRVPSKRRDGV